MLNSCSGAIFRSMNRRRPAQLSQKSPARNPIFRKKRPAHLSFWRDAQGVLLFLRFGSRCVQAALFAALFASAEFAVLISVPSGP